MANYQLPKGTEDVLPKDIEKWHNLEGLIKDFCSVYNYKEIRTPIFEHTNVFARGNDSSDMVNKEMYTFFANNSKTSLTLRPEMTAGVARSFVQNKLYGNSELPLKLYYVGPQFRHEQPQKGRLRIFHQFGVEVLGDKNPLLDVEAITLGWSYIQALGLKDLKVLINTLGDDASRDAYRVALKDHFASDIENMCDDCKRRYEQNPLRILDCKIDHERDSMKNAPSMSDYLNEESKEYFAQVLAGLDALDIPYEIDDRLVRGLDYYTHTVFEVVSVNEAMGSQSTVFAGGRYDNLIPYFGGPAMSGIGWAMGLERLIIACEAEGISLQDEAELDAYVLCLDEELELAAFQIVTMLRSGGYMSETDYMHRSFKAQFKSVDRLNAKYAVIVGKKDFEEGNVTIKEIATQTQEVVKIEDIVEAMDRFNEEGSECECGHHHHHE